MAILDLAAYTFTPNQVKEMQGAILETVEGNPLISNYLTIVVGLKRMTK